MNQDEEDNYDYFESKPLNKSKNSGNQSDYKSSDSDSDDKTSNVNSDSDDKSSDSDSDKSSDSDSDKSSDSSDDKTSNVNSGNKSDDKSSDSSDDKSSDSSDDKSDKSSDSDSSTRDNLTSLKTPKNNLKPKIYKCDSDYDNSLKILNNDHEYENNDKNDQLNYGIEGEQRAYGLEAINKTSRYGAKGDLLSSTTTSDTKLNKNLQIMLRNDPNEFLKTSVITELKSETFSVNGNYPLSKQDNDILIKTLPFLMSSFNKKQSRWFNPIWYIYAYIVNKIGNTKQPPYADQNTINVIYEYVNNNTNYTITPYNLIKYTRYVGDLMRKLHRNDIFYSKQKYITINNKNTNDASSQRSSLSSQRSSLSSQRSSRSSQRSSRSSQRSSRSSSSL